MAPRAVARWPQAVPVEVFSGLYAKSLEHVGDCVRRWVICTEIELCNGRPTGVVGLDLGDRSFTPDPGEHDCGIHDDSFGGEEPEVV